MKNIIITGASRGIGLATAKKFLTQDWHVIGTYNQTTIPLKHNNLRTLKLDQGSPDSIIQATNQIKNTYSHIDALVNNAAIILDAEDETVGLENIRQTFEVDLFGLIDVTERLVPLLKNGSHIINIDSSYGSFSLPIDDKTSTGYRMAKAALNMYTRTLAFRLKDQGIIVSSLDPGWVQTDMGYIGATEEEKPDRSPDQPADEI
ncbi:SDR family NAD(P)-dependent oxidoreductase, partial [Patescibacteria group bacterium AH-259-L07]|nr:SDR family NAD(P)-dependent oxidoreductase [Patescibacteria group bacterium AH-259-L07]